jgi:hypothetical protein
MKKLIKPTKNYQKPMNDIFENKNNYKKTYHKPMKNILKAL